MCIYLLFLKLFYEKAKTFEFVEITYEFLDVGLKMFTLVYAGILTGI